MKGNIRLWQRDENILSDLKQGPMTTSQIARRQRASYKKIAARLYRFVKDGLAQRVPYVPKDWQRGNVEFAYSVGRPLRQRTLHHDILISEAKVRIVELLRGMNGFTAQFLSPGDVRLGCGLLPDLTVLIRRPDQRLGCWFIEGDCGTESIASSHRYSLAGKMVTYAGYYDAGQYEADFAFAGVLRSFRVALIVPRARLHSVQRLILQEQHNFVLLTSLDRLSEGFQRPIWRTCERETDVDFFGRGGEQTGEQTGDQSPTSETHNS
jgi:hypothetical protein